MGAGWKRNHSLNSLPGIVMLTASFRIPVLIAIGRRFWWGGCIFTGNTGRISSGISTLLHFYGPILLMSFDDIEFDESIMYLDSGGYLLYPEEILNMRLLRHFDCSSLLKMNLSWVDLRSKYIL
ncbi:hypothetical protein NPIL_529161 [Nephila pilipes]|uniref:Uncharacterized protein n=1 Tax=Nephila pilipes TaxID=299642 RepID=A0A8X6PRN0_NEPPI|nr:hypothetical protein NPIL_529161 [Nephila pilipes]